MPQLDPTTFAPQLFWLVISFVALYFAMWKVALPRLSGLLRERQERIDDDLERAEKLKSDAETVIAAYEKAMTEGRAKAQGILRDAAERMARESEARHAALTEKLAAQTAEAEARIGTARNEALQSIRTVAADAARAAAARLVGAEVSDAEAQSAVAAEAEERA